LFKLYFIDEENYNKWYEQRYHNKPIQDDYPVKKTITIEVEGEDPSWIIEWFKDKAENLNETYYKNKIKVNIKEDSDD
jgi:predicted metallopeptidase